MVKEGVVTSSREADLAVETGGAASSIGGGVESDRLNGTGAGGDINLERYSWLFIVSLSKNNASFGEIRIL